MGVNKRKKLFSSVLRRIALSLPKVHEFTVILSTLVVPSCALIVMLLTRTVNENEVSTRVMLVANSCVVAEVCAQNSRVIVPTPPISGLASVTEKLPS